MFRAVPLPIIRGLFIVHSALVYVIQVWRQLSSRTRMEPPETCRVSCRSKFGKSVHLVDFIMKKVEGYCCTWSYSVTHTHTHTHSVGLLWARDRLVTETSNRQHKTFTRQTSMPPAEFEHAIWACQLPQTHSLARVATGIVSSRMFCPIIITLMPFPIFSNGYVTSDCEIRPRPHLSLITRTLSVNRKLLYGLRDVLAQQTLLQPMHRRSERIQTDLQVQLLHTSSQWRGT